MRLSRPYKLFANERMVIDEAYPGDVLGLPNTGDLAIGDTLCGGKIIRFARSRASSREHSPCCATPI